MFSAFTEFENTVYIKRYSNWPVEIHLGFFKRKYKNAFVSFL